MLTYSKLCVFIPRYPARKTQVVY